MNFAVKGEERRVYSVRSQVSGLLFKPFFFNDYAARWVIHLLNGVSSELGGKIRVPSSKMKTLGGKIQTKGVHRGLKLL
jgi:hypothetical protein